MIFINRLLKIVLLASLLFYAGCSAVGYDDHSAGLSSDESSEGTRQNKVIFVAPQNPYLLDSRKVPSDARELFDNARTLMESDNDREAIIILEEMIGKYPKFSGAYVNLGIVFFRAGRESDAENMFKQSIKVNKNNIEAYNQLGFLYRQQGNFAEAEKVYSDSLAVWPNYANIHYNLGILYELYMGKLDKALFHYEAYQALQATEDRKVKGWIIDLKRRLQRQENEQAMLPMSVVPMSVLPMEEVVSS